MKPLPFIILFVLFSAPMIFAQEDSATDQAVTIIDEVTVDETEAAKEEEDASPFKAETFSSLKLRGIGPALMSGRIIDIAKNPSRKSTWYVAVASGGVWKTVNAGTTWEPIFDGQGSYSIGCITLDPNDPLCVWVGSGENNSQRSVGFGDGVYRSIDGGVNWENMGLDASEHIGKILVDPRDSNRVYVAAQGPLWAPGGDRGLYKSEDRGKTWDLVLEISENTGVSDLAFDPRDLDVIYASSYQRRRHVWTLIDGGPESALYKSTDQGATWRKLTNGLPDKDMGRIAVAVSPMRPDVVYALIEAEGDAGGFFRSTNGGGSWEKRSGYKTVSPQYYQELFCDPHVFDRVYSMDTMFQVTNDGGRTFHAIAEKFKHVDNHALYFDEDDPDYLLVGCDGGLYESFDRAKTWDFKANLPVTQFYKLCTDNDLPFYNVYGGTQDNNTQGGPSRTLSRHGIANQDWIITIGGDGFKPQVDPLDPNIIYCQSQYGELERFDRRSGERIGIQPQPEADGEALRWNWDSPIMISPHSHTRIYFAADRIFRSDDRGDSWTPISPDLTRRIDRNMLEVMGRIWSVDAVARHDSTSFYGNIVALAESPLKENLLYAGTDDGLIRVSENGGTVWTRLETFPGIPELAYVADIEASMHDENTVFAVFNAHKSGDFKPYILMSEDRGGHWVSIAGDLPERGPVWAIAQDHVDANLLFAGTEFGLYFTADKGKKWIRLKGGLPTIAIRDIEIQRRESDLACASFGRGFYILDDYSPLRYMSEERLENEAILFPVKDALQYVPTQLTGYREKGCQGDAFYTAPNPPYGAVFTYYLKEGFETLKEQRRKAEVKIEKEGESIPWPGWEDLRAEDEEEKPCILFYIRNKEGEPIRIVKGDAKKGFHRVAWDLRYPAFTPYDGKSDDSGPMVLPGPYTVTMASSVRGEVTMLGEARSFEVKWLDNVTLPADDPDAMLAFQMKTGDLQKAVLGAGRLMGETKKRLERIKGALEAYPKTSSSLIDEVRMLEKELKDMQIAMDGDPTKKRRNHPVPPGIRGRVQRIVSGQWNSSRSAPTQTQHRAYEIAAALFKDVPARLGNLVEVEIPRIEETMEKAGVPWTTGRVPEWKGE